MKSAIDIEKYRNIPFKTRKSCMICDKKTETPIIDMRGFPLTEIYVDRKVDDKIGILDQGFCLCPNCGHGQIMNVIDVEFQYGDISDYYFRSSGSATARETVNFFIQFFNRITGNKKFQTIIELGCNDLYLLRNLKSRADKLVGIDPILKGKEDKFSQENITAIGDFFENTDLVDLGSDVIICKDTLEHVSDPKQFVKRIVANAHNETLFFFQFPLLETLLTDCRFDQIFHQHLNYFSLKSILYMLDEIGCKLLDYSVNYSHWGSILTAFRKGKDNSRYNNKVWRISPQDILERYNSFKSDIEQINKRLEYFSKELIYGYGAALMLPVLDYYIKGLRQLKYIIDDEVSKRDLYYLNFPVQIKLPEQITDIKNSVVLLTAISSSQARRAIISKLINLKVKQIIVPFNLI